MAGPRITGLQLYRVPVTSRGDWLLLKVAAGDREGWGEASQSRADAVVADLVHNRLLPLVLQGTVDDAFTRLRTMYRDDVWKGLAGLAGVTARSALEQALWDLKAKTLGVPLHQLLGGGRRSEIRLYANLNRGLFERSPQSFAEAALRAVEAGFDAVKAAPFDEVRAVDGDTWATRQAVEVGFARLSAVKDAVGGRAELLVDCHGRFNRQLALHVGHELERLGAAWVEDPIWPDEDPVGLAAIAARLDIPVVAGEQLAGLGRHADLARLGAADILAPDVKHCGGIWEALRIATVAEANGLMIAPTTPAGLSPPWRVST